MTVVDRLYWEYGMSNMGYWKVEQEQLDMKIEGGNGQYQHYFQTPNHVVTSSEARCD